VAEKSLIHSSSCSIFVICGGEISRKRHMGRGGWPKTLEYHHMCGGGLKLLKKLYMIFERSLIPQKSSNHQIL